MYIPIYEHSYLDVNTFNVWVLNLLLTRFIIEIYKVFMVHNLFISQLSLS